MGDNINPNQFKLFYSADELQNSITHSGDRSGGETLPQMWDRKLTESKEPVSTERHGAGVHDSLSAQGWKGRPLTVVHDERGQTVWDGNHRIAAAADLERTTGRNTWIPVDHSELDKATDRSLGNAHPSADAWGRPFGNTEAANKRQLSSRTRGAVEDLVNQIMKP